MRREDKEKLRQKEEDIEARITSMLSTPAGLNKIASAFANPIRRNLNYSSVLRRAVTITKLKRTYRRIIGVTFKPLTPMKRESHISTFKVLSKNAWGNKKNQYNVRVTNKWGNMYEGIMPYCKIVSKRFCQV